MYLLTGANWITLPGHGSWNEFNVYQGLDLNKCIKWNWSTEPRSKNRHNFHRLVCMIWTKVHWPHLLFITPRRLRGNNRLCHDDDEPVLLYILHSWQNRSANIWKARCAMSMKSLYDPLRYTPSRLSFLSKVREVSGSKISKKINNKDLVCLWNDKVIHTLFVARVVEFNSAHIGPAVDKNGNGSATTGHNKLVSKVEQQKE